MIWKIIVILIIFLLIILIPIKIKVDFNILKLSGAWEVHICKIIKFRVRVRIRGRYIYITKNGKTRREKLSSKNYSVALILKLINETYFRTELNQLTIKSEIGYCNNAMVSAIGCSVVDIITKCSKARIAHNKKAAHIFVLNEPKYNGDYLNIKLESDIKISIFDIVYSLTSTLLSLKGDNYEREKAVHEQNQEFD